MRPSHLELCVVCLLPVFSDFIRSCFIWDGHKSNIRLDSEKRVRLSFFGKRLLLLFRYHVPICLASRGHYYN